MRELPKGWAECTLAEVGEVVTGNTPPKNNTANYGKKYPWVKPPDLGSDAPITKTGESLSAEGARLARLLPSETTLVSCIGILGKVGYAGTTLATNQQINSVVFDTTLVEPRYGFQYCKTLREWMDQNSSSTTVTIINKGRFSQAPFLLPPLPEQRRIVARLEKLLGKVGACEKRLAKIPVILKRFRQSVLAAACSGRLTTDWRDKNQMDDVSENGELPLGWHWRTVEELLPPGGIFDGPFGSNLKTADYANDGVRVVRLGNIGHLRFIHEKESYISQQKYETLTKHRVGAGDIIFASFIDEEVRACVLPRFPTKVIAKADCFCLRPRPELADWHYLAFQLVSRESYNRLIENVHGATRPRVNTSQLRKLEIRVSPLSEQQEIVRRVEALFSLADQIEARYSKAKGRVDQITQSLLAKAFCGELVSQNPNDEPASVLLERIKTERTKREMEVKGHEVGKRKATKERMKKRY